MAAREVFVEHEGIRQPAPAPRFSRTTTSLGLAPRPRRSPADTREALVVWGIADVDGLIERGSRSRRDAADPLSTCVPLLRPAQGCAASYPPSPRRSDFALDKPSGVPCPNLLAEHFGCSIHAELRDRGFPGCTVYDCFGAGQRVVQEHFGGRDWRTSPEIGRTCSRPSRSSSGCTSCSGISRRRLDRPSTGRCATRSRGRETGAGSGRAPLDVDVVTLQLRADPLLGEVSARVRAGADGAGTSGAVTWPARTCAPSDLAAADLRGAVLIGADLRDVDLTDADVLGADLRGADVRGADLSTVAVPDAGPGQRARGDDRTGLPGVARPALALGVTGAGRRTGVGRWGRARQGHAHVGQGARERRRSPTSDICMPPGGPPLSATRVPPGDVRHKRTGLTMTVLLSQ